MRVLAVDTSSGQGSVALVEDGFLLGEVRLACSVQHSERLFRSVEFLIESVPFTLASVDLFAAARGPGSFTGLRVGLAAMEGFAAAYRKPAAGVSTLEALAWKTGVRNASIAPTIDARRGEVYGAIYRRDGDRLIEEHPPVVLKPADWFDALPDHGIHICGDAVERYRSLIDKRPWVVHKMDAYLAGTIAELASTPGQRTLEPLYVRKTEAELRREREHESVADPNP